MLRVRVGGFYIGFVVVDRWTITDLLRNYVGEHLLDVVYAQNYEDHSSRNTWLNC